jgi:hypothetical protein
VIVSDLMLAVVHHLSTLYLIMVEVSTAVYDSLIY